MTWSATQYSKFETERTRPVLDLLGRVPTVRAASAVDIGCGPGNSTEQLKRRFPEAVIAGIDSSADMVEAARKRMPDTQFDLEDIITWSTKPAFFDVILANAVFQWVPDHSLLLPAVFAKLTRCVSPYGPRHEADDARATTRARANQVKLRSGRARLGIEGLGQRIRI